MVVLDTNVVSYLFDRDSRADYYQEHIRGRRAVISFQTLEEVWFGAYSEGWGKRRMNELAHHLEQYEVVWPSLELVVVYAANGGPQGGNCRRPTPGSRQRL